MNDYSYHTLSSIINAFKKSVKFPFKYLPDVVKASDARLFADDCLLYGNIRNDKDSADIKTDIFALED